MKPYRPALEASLAERVSKFASVRGLTTWNRSAVKLLQSTASAALAALPPTMPLATTSESAAQDESRRMRRFMFTPCLRDTPVMTARRRSDAVVTNLRQIKASPSNNDN